MKKIKPKALSKVDGQKANHPDICKRFLETRAQLNLTQEEFGEMLGLKLSSVKHIELGYYSPTINTIINWNKRCRKTLNWIFYGVD